MGSGTVQFTASFNWLNFLQESNIWTACKQINKQVSEQQQQQQSLALPPEIISIMLCRFFGFDPSGSFKFYQREKMIECRLLRFILVWAVVLARYDKQSHLFDRRRRSRGSPHLIFYAFSYQTISQHWQQPENPAKHFLPIFAFPPSDSVAAYLFIFYFRHIKYLFTFLVAREGERERERLRKKQSFFAKFKKTWTDVLRMPKISACEKDTSCQAICHLWSVRFFNIFKSLHALSAKLESVTFPAFLTFFWRTQRTWMKQAVAGRPVIETNHLPPISIDFQDHVSSTMSAQVDSHPSTVHLQSCFTSLF